MAEIGQERIQITMQESGYSTALRVCYVRFISALFLDDFAGLQLIRDLMVMDKKDKVWIAATVGPLFVMTILSLLIHLFRRWYPEFSAPIYPVEYALALGVGVVSIDTLSISKYQKAFVLAVYIPFEIFTLFVFSVTFGCLAFGNCP